MSGMNILQPDSVAGCRPRRRHVGMKPVAAAAFDAGRRRHSRAYAAVAAYAYMTGGRAHGRP